MTTARRTLLLLATGLVAVGAVTTVAVGRRGGGCRAPFADIRPVRAPRADAVPDMGPIEDDDLTAITAGGAAAGHPVRWAAFESEDAALPVISGDRVVVRDLGVLVTPVLRAYDLATGVSVWRGELPDVGAELLPLDGAVAVAVGSSDDGGPVRLGVVDRQGRVVACRTFERAVAPGDRPQVDVAGDGHRLVVVRPTSTTSVVESFAGPDLTLQWSSALPFTAGAVAVGGDTVVVYPVVLGSDDDVALAALDASTGAVRWRRTYAELPAVTGRPVLAAHGIDAATVMGDAIVLLAGERDPRTLRVSDATAFAVSAADGTPRWQRSDLEVGALGGLLDAGDVAVLTGAVGSVPDVLGTTVDLVGLDAATGVERWRAPAVLGIGAAAGARQVFVESPSAAVDDGTGAVTPLATSDVIRRVATAPGVAVVTLRSGVVVALEDPA